MISGLVSYLPGVAKERKMELGNVYLGLCSNDVFRHPYYTEIIAGIHTAAHEKNHVRFIRFFDELKDPILFNELVYEEEIGSMILVSSDQCIKDDTDRAIMEKSVSVLKRSYM